MVDLIPRGVKLDLVRAFWRAGVLEARGEEVRHREEAGDSRREPPVVHGVSQGGEAPPRGPLLDGKVGAIFLQLF